MVLFLNKKKLQEQKPLVNKTYQGKYDYSGMPLVKEDYKYGFDSLVEHGKIIKKDNKLSLLERITPIAEAEEIQTDRKPIEEIFAKKDVERIKFDYQINEEAERLNKPINIAMRTVTGIPKHTAIIGKEIGQSIARNVSSFFSAETLSPLVGKLQNIQKRLEENNITYGFFAEEMRDRLLGDLSSDEVVELTGETRGEQVVPAEQRIENLKNKLKEKANNYREKAKDENGIAKLVHETLADVLSTEGGALGVSSTLVLGSIALDLTGYGGTKKGLTKALRKSDNIIDAARVLMRAGLDEKTALSFADDVVKIRTTKAANSFINNLEVTLKTTKPVSKRIPLGEIIKKESNIEDVIFQEAKKYKSAEEFGKVIKDKFIKEQGFEPSSMNVVDEWWKAKQIQPYVGIGGANPEFFTNRPKLSELPKKEISKYLKFTPEGKAIYYRGIDKNVNTRNIRWGDFISPDKGKASLYGKVERYEIDPKYVYQLGDLEAVYFNPKDKLKTPEPQSITEIWNKANQATAEQSLIQEAKKYKSAEEFVKAQGTPVYHGTNATFKVFDKSKIGSATDDGIAGRGFYFTTNKKFANDYAKKAGGDIVMETYLPAKEIFDLSDIKTARQASEKFNMPQGDFVVTGEGKVFPKNFDVARKMGEKIEEMGYAGASFKRYSDTVETVIFNPSKIKTKSQLEDIWNKANKNVEIEPLIQEAKKYNSAEEFVKNTNWKQKNEIVNNYGNNYEYHLSTEPNLAEGKTFAEQITKGEIGIRGQSMGEGVYSTKNPQYWESQLAYEANGEVPKHLYLVKVKNGQKSGMLESGFEAQTLNNPNEITVIKKILTNDSDMPLDIGLAESVRDKEILTDIWNKANKNIEIEPLIQEAKKYKSAEEFVKAKTKRPDYGYGHSPNEDGVRAFDLTEKVGGEQMIPKDMYTKWYGSRGTKADLESISVLKKIKGNPEADVIIYRAAPKEGFNYGDWITLSKDYARQHAEANNFKVFSQKVKAKDIRWAMDDVNEFGYFPESTKPQLEDIWNKANENIEIEPLIQEAKKYKSADEFVKAQPKLYHGGSADIKDIQLGKSNFQKTFYMSENPDYAKSFGGNKSSLNEIMVDSKAKLADLRKPSDDLVKQIEDIISSKPTGKTVRIQKPDGTFLEIPETKGGLSNPVHSSEDILNGIRQGKAYFAEMPEVKKALKKLGYDGQITSEVPYAKNIGVWNKEVIKTKSQLEEIWNKANQATSISSDLVKTGEQAKGNVLKIIQNTPETTTKKILTSAKETPIEFGLGKGVIQEKIISNEASKLNDLLNRAKITKEESLELFNAFDNPQKYKLSQSLINKNGDDIIKEGRRLNSFLSEQKLSRGVIDRVYDDETYLRTVLETLDGKKPTAEQVARLRNATNQTFRDQLARDLTGFSGKLREKIKTDIRKYRTADERDVILESFGLRTKRDFVNSMSENIRLTTRATSNKEFNDAVRSIAKDGFWVKGKKLVKRDDIIEAYDPFVVSKTRQEIKNNTSKKISKIIDEIKKERILTENEAKIIKDIIYEQKEEAIKELKDSHKYALDDIDNIINFTKQQIARVKNTLLDEKAILLERKTKLIENIRDEAKKELNDFYGKITIKRGELIDKGFKDAGSISGAEPLRGVMLNKKDYRALKEFVEELGESSLEDFAKTIKYFQATLDLFQIPQLLRSSISSSGFIKGSWDWLKAVVKSSGVSVDDMVKSSEFVQQGRFKDFDIDIWNKQLKDMNDNTSWFMKQFKKLGKKTDNMPVVRDVLNGIGAIDEYQFQTVMIPLKTKAWLRKIDELKRLYPNLDERSIMVEAGRFIDDYFGGQQWDKLMARNPRLASRQNQRISRIMIFATDYLTSTMRKLKRETFDAFTKWGVPEGNMARKALAREIIFGLGLVNAISYMTRGKSAFENDDPNQFYKLQTNIEDGGGNPYYLDIMGNWGQTWNLINRPIDAIRGKISGIGKIGVSLLADGELKIGEALNPIPFSWRSILETAYNHALGRKTGTQIPETIGGGALITLMEFMGLAGTFSGGKSRRQTLMRMIEAESFTPDEVWKYLTGQNVFTNKERITRMIEKDGISDAYSWELEQKKKGYLSEESYPTRDALKTKYGITGSITNNENILRINRMTKEEQRIFIEGYSEKTQELIKDKIKTGSYKKSLSDIFK